MPIKDKSVYAENWKEISRRVREEAGQKCEICGVQNGNFIFRSLDQSCWYDPAADAYFSYPCGERLPDSFESELKEKGVRIVLTVAHLDRDPANNERSNLRAWCQLCHLRHDAQQHAANARQTRMSRKACAPLDLFAE